MDGSGDRGGWRGAWTKLSGRSERPEEGWCDGGAGALMSRRRSRRDGGKRGKRTNIMKVKFPFGLLIKMSNKGCNFPCSPQKKVKFYITSVFLPLLLLPNPETATQATKRTKRKLTLTAVERPGDARRELIRYEGREAGYAVRRKAKGRTHGGLIFNSMEITEAKSVLLAGIGMPYTARAV
ncbi:hypothetical protein GWI33_016893 [Rhynchophorus ferrugineus]|uniref:Uncharacterized protein n=1 Tax=Rhynchophorus ferrugineus TaxID=354439 RepID=A0A834M9U6_RHYFE|nr:hypothetical protein GWI33_016893 [Rhynchophorus ferrugineus]